MPSDDDDAEALRRLLDYDRKRYWLSNGWCLLFRVHEVPVSVARPHGIKYSFTLHDIDMTRLLGIDNAHGLPRRQAYDHRHRFRRTAELVLYVYKNADTLLVDFFGLVEGACRQEGVGYTFDDHETELENEDGEEISD